MIPRIFASLFLLLAVAPSAQAADARPTAAPSINCPGFYELVADTDSLGPIKSTQRGLSKPSAATGLEAKMRESKLTLDTPIYAYHADGKPYRVEFAIIDSDGNSLAALEAELRAGGEVYIEHVRRSPLLAGYRTSEWLKKKLMEKYPVRKISSDLSDSEFNRVEVGLGKGEPVDEAVKHSMAYKSCIELGFLRTSAQLMGNSVKFSCEK